MTIELTMVYEGTKSDDVKFDIFPLEIPQDHINRKNKLIVFKDIKKAMDTRQATNPDRRYIKDVSIRWSQ